MSDESAPATAAAPIERRLATILCADVAGYSQMMGVDEERTVRVFRGHREVFESLVGMHRGRVFNTAGDALLVEFNSAVEAVRCATEIQAALRTRNEHLAPDEKMQFRIGINLGDVVIQGGDLLGDGVNVAARIQAATEPGGICISGSVHDQIQNKLSLDFKLLGEQSYKNIARPVRTYTIAEGAAVTAPRKRRPATLATAVIAAAFAVAGAGYWGYRQYEGDRSERARMAAELAAQKYAAEQAQRAAENTRREAQLQLQKLSAEEALRRAQEERVRMAQERKRLETEQRVSESGRARTDVAPHRVAPARAVSAAARDGTYSGRLCNAYRNSAPKCWPVILLVRSGVVEGSWRSVGDRTSTASGTIGADGATELRVAGWTRSGKPDEAMLSGRTAGGAISASGNWRTGGQITGMWNQAQSGAGGLAAASAGGRDANVYEGRLCMPRQGQDANCWAVTLLVRHGAIEGSWLGRMNKTARAAGKIEPDGSVRLKLSAWRRNGTPIDGILSGRIESGTIDAAGQWSDNAKIFGTWKKRI